MKVDKQADSLLRKAQVGKQLRIMNRCQLINSLNLHHYGIFYNQIEALSAVEFHIFVHDRKRLLLVNLEAELPQLKG